MPTFITLDRNDRIQGYLNPDPAIAWNEVPLHSPVEAALVGGEIQFTPLTTSEKFFGLLVSKESHEHDGKAEVYKLTTGYRYNGVAQGALAFGDPIKAVAGGFQKWVDGTDDAKLLIGRVVSGEAVAANDPFNYTAGGQ